MEEVLKVAILGAGAMGSLFATFLSKNSRNDDVFLIDHRKDKIDKINDKGIGLRNKLGKTSFYKIGAYKNDEEIPEVDLIFVFVKSIKNQEALSKIVPIIGKETILVSLQNGYGNDRDLEDFQDKSHVVIGSTTHGATLIADGEVFHAGSGMTYLGENDQNKRSVEFVYKVLKDIGLDVEITEDIERLVIEKLFINIGINPITALIDKENACIYENDYARDMSRLLVYEACDVFKLYCYDFNREEILSKVLETAKKTGKNTSSMRADLRRGNETEISKINGIIAEKARIKNVESPYNEAISLLIKAKEREK